MQKINKNEIINKHSLFLLKKYSGKRKSKTNYYSYIKRNNSLLKNYNNKKILTSIRQKSFLNNTKFQSYLLNFTNKSKIENNEKDFDNSFIMMTSYPTKKNGFNKSTLKILKDLFPNMSELNIYSNYPLYPFDNNEKIYNSYQLIKNEGKKENLKKKIMDFYKKNIFRQDSQNKMTKRIIISDDNEEKNKSNGKFFNNIYINDMYLTKKAKEDSKLSQKNISFHYEDLPLKIINLNIYNNNTNKEKGKTKLIKTKKNSFNDIFKNKEINKYFNSDQPFPIINIKKENSYKYIKILKNLKEKDCVNKNKISYSLTPQVNNIQSVFSRNNKITYENSNLKIYEEKATYTNED